MYLRLAITVYVGPWSSWFSPFSRLLLRMQKETSHLHTVLLPLGCGRSDSWHVTVLDNHFRPDDFAARIYDLQGAICLRINQLDSNAARAVGWTACRGTIADHIPHSEVLHQIVVHRTEIDQTAVHGIEASSRDIGYLSELGLGSVPVQTCIGACVRIPHRSVAQVGTHIDDVDGSSRGPHCVQGVGVLGLAKSVDA